MAKTVDAVSSHGFQGNALLYRIPNENDVDDSVFVALQCYQFSHDTNCQRAAKEPGEGLSDLY